MLFLVLNIIFSVFLIYLTVYIDRKNSLVTTGSNPIVAYLMMFAINVCLFTFFLLVRKYITPLLFSSLIKLCFILEGCMLINVSFCLTYYAWKYTNGVNIAIKTFLMIFVVWLVMFNFQSIKYSEANGLEISSKYIFSGAARAYFPWTWVTVYKFVLRFMIPCFHGIIMLLKNEHNGTKLDRFRGYVYMLGILSMWALSFFLDLSVSYVPSFSLLHYIVYIPMFIIIPLGSNIVAAPSGRSTMSFVVKSLCLYLLPAIIMGEVFMFLYPLHDKYRVLFVLLAFASAVAIFVLINTINNIISKSKLGHSTDYAFAFEKALASVDYSGEMDDIAETMFSIFKTNAESTSMAVFINGGNDTYEVAYSSSKKNKKICNYGNLFESLLNDKRNVLVYSEIDSDNNFSEYRQELHKFFQETKSDALFILNEGRDVHGLILLGIKESNEHYKEYDVNVFKKLYSYFFVFGYYMRNISNKEIIGTVNRELRMSSQIITSIQDNIDILDNPKIDAGCIMVPAHNIGGEFVDMIRLTDSRHMFVIGDLSGKGIAASMSMVILKQIIRAYLADTHDFKQLVVKVNRFIRDNLQKGTIFSGMFAIMNFENDTLYYINCGIPAILLYTEAYNNVIEIQGGGHILGFVKDISSYITIKQIKLNKNDIVLACTDGLIESHSLRGEKFGKDRIQRYMVANAMYPAYRMAQFEYDELVKFMSHEMEDDVSVLVLKYLRSNASEKAEAEAVKAKFYESMVNANSDDVVKQIEQYEGFVQKIAPAEEE